MSLMSGDGGFRQELSRCQALVESRLSGYFTREAKYAALLEAMRYSLLGGGKRIRAVICLKFSEAAGGRMEDALEAACAIEMLHAYSLIHDDLPCMDDDEMRRGKPSNHKKYGESTATLAGDALQAAAFETILSSALPAAAVVLMGKALAGAAGPDGICGGQYLDLNYEDKPPDKGELAVIHELKTAVLMSASARIGVLAAGGSDKQLAAAEEYARAVGLAFQARDDLLDMDFSDGGQMRIVREETDKAVRAVERGDFGDTRFLVWLARMLEERKS
jgi:geranylgeranyl diphosphate synthase type II